MRNVRDFSVNRLPSGSLIAVWLNKRDTLLCVPTGTRNSVCFEVGLICTVIDHVTVSERAAWSLSTASVIGQIHTGKVRSLV